MRNLLKSLMLCGAFLSTFISYGQMYLDILPNDVGFQSRIDSIAGSKKTENALAIRSIVNYYFIDMPGFDMTSANYQNLDAMITTLNNEGWDVKILGYYGLDKYKSEIAQNDLIASFIQDKQVIIDIRNLDLKLDAFEVSVRSPDLPTEHEALLGEIVTAAITGKVNRYNGQELLDGLAYGLSKLTAEFLSGVVYPEGSSGRNGLGVLGFGRVDLPKDCILLSPGNIPIHVKKGTTVAFWRENGCADGECKELRGTVAYIFQNDIEYVAKFQVRDGKKYIYFGNDKNKIVGLHKASGQSTDAVLGLFTGPCDNSSTTQVLLKEVTFTYNYDVTKLLNSTTDLGEFTDIKDQSIPYESIYSYTLDGIKYIPKTVVDKEALLTAYCGQSIDGLELFRSLNLNGEFAVINYKQNNPDLYQIIFKDKGKFVLYDSELDIFRVAENNQHSWSALNVENYQSYKYLLKYAVENKLNDMKLYQIGKTVVIIVVSVAVGVATSGASFAAQLAAEATLIAAEAGVVYLYEKDPNGAVNAVVTGALGGIAGAAMGKILSKVPLEVDETAEAVAGGVKEAGSNAAANVKQVTKSNNIVQPDAILNTEFGRVSLQDVGKYSREVLNFSKEKLAKLGDDIAELAKKGKQSLLLGCVNPVSAFGDRGEGDGNRSVKECHLKAWEAMIPDELLRKDASWLTKVSDYFTIKPNRLDEFKSHFIIEKGKGRAQVYLKSLTERQTHVGPVFRNQQSSLGYEDFFNNGMTPKGTHDNLLMHTESNTTAGNFISTTLDKDIATQFGSQNGWVFEIRSTNGIDINKTLGADALHPGQLEVSIPDVILPKDIKGVWQKQGGVLTTWIPNPNYIP